MENMNLLDLDNDILNIIGDYVKKDNHDREFQEYMMRNQNKIMCHICNKLYTRKYMSFI